MFCTRRSSETHDSGVFRKHRNALTGALRFTWVMLLGTCVCGMSQDTPSDAAAMHTVHAYPMLDASQIYSPGQKVKVEEPHGIYKGWILMDDYYFVRPTRVTETERREELGSPGSFDTNGSLSAYMRHSTSRSWERVVFTYGCDSRELKVGQIELARASDSREFIVGSHTSVCKFTAVVASATPSSSPTPAHDSFSEPTVTWEPAVPPQAFPAVILSTGSTSARAGEKSETLCDPRSSFRVRVKSSTPATRIHVEARVDGFFLDVSSCDAILENAGQEYVVAPTPRWDFHKLAFNDQPYPATVVLSMKANGIDLGQKTTRLQIRAVNDVPFAVKDAEGRVTDQSPFFAAFVNENSPIVEVILKEALQWGAVGDFAGYQKHSAEDVRMQIFAIWNVLQRHDVKYSSITTASGFSENVQSQSVRFVDDAFRMSQANCVDGSVLFASVLYKIDIRPVLVKTPDHMFLGYYLNPQSQGTLDNLEFLETTMLGSGPPLVLHDQPFPRRDAEWLRSTISFREFAAAIERGNEQFRTQVLPRLRENDMRYKIIGVRKARENGISPIPR